MSRLIRPTSLRLPDEIERHTTWLEIFFDLIFAVIVVQLSDRLSNNFTVTGILQCLALFIPSLWAWVSYTVFAARFDNNDMIHWSMTFVIMFAAAVMAIQIPTALEEGATGFSVGFLISQISILLLYSRTYYDDRKTRDLTLFYIIGFGLGCSFWIVSLFFDSPEKLIFWALGMSVYLLIPWLGRKKVLSKAPLDTMYIPERFGSFTIIVLGQIIAAVVFGLESAHWNPESILTSMLAFLLAIVIWGQYYLFTQTANYKCTLGSGQPYIYTHIPLITSLILIGVSAQDFISKDFIHPYVKIIFCSSIILYLSSFYLLQSIAMPRFRRLWLIYLLGVFGILGVFLLSSLSPLLIMLGIVIVFIALFVLQQKVKYKNNRC